MHLIPTIRYYQTDCKNGVYAGFRQGKRVLLQMPTGSGKTVTFSDICLDAARAGKRFLILVHRRELIKQAWAKLKDFGLHADIIMGKHRWSPNTGAFVASVQTLSRRDLPPADVVIVDEAHHAAADTYIEILNEYQGRGAFILGVTATPCRLNGRGFEGVFDEMVLGPSIKKLAAEGFLVIPRVFAAPPPDTKGLHVRQGEYKQEEAALLMEQNVLNGDLVRMYRKHARGQKLLGFAASVELSKHYAEEYVAAGITAAHVDGKTRDEDRDMIFQRFREGSLGAVWNYNIISEGFDVPDAGVVQIVCPTKSLVKYMQMVGRIMRPSPDKTGGIVLDHAGVTFEHGFVQDDRIWTLEGLQKKEKSPENGDFAETLELCALCEMPRKVIALEKRQGIFNCHQAELCPLAQAAKEYKHNKDRELAELSEEQHGAMIADIKRRHELERLLDIVEQRDWRNEAGKLKYGWAWWKFLETHSPPRPEEITLMRKRAKYHHGWERREQERLLNLNNNNTYADQLTL